MFKEFLWVAFYLYVVILVSAFGNVIGFHVANSNITAFIGSLMGLGLTSALFGEARR